MAQGEDPGAAISTKLSSPTRMGRAEASVSRTGRSHASDRTWTTVQSLALEKRLWKPTCTLDGGCTKLMTFMTSGTVQLYQMQDRE